MSRKTFSQIRLGFYLLIIIILSGTALYSLIEDWSLFESLYMTIITISTTGFGEVHPLTSAGRVLTILLVVSGVLTLAYTGGKAAQLVLETQIIRRRKMSRQLDSLSDHYIVCGYGRMGKNICETLRDNKIPFVVIEQDPAQIDELAENEILYIIGSSSDDENLLKAGIMKSRGLISVVNSDAENVFTTLTAKGLNPDIYIVARAIEDNAAGKLKRAGASRVVKPIELASSRMAQLVMRPGVIDFIDNIARSHKRTISLEEINVHKNSELVDKSLAESSIRKNLNIIIIGISRSGGDFIYNPGPAEKIITGDKLIAIGETQNLVELNRLCLEEFN